MEVMKTVHGGSYPMFQDRILSEMGREPDDEHVYYSSVVRGNMTVIVYKLPSGCRIWFKRARR